jgi:putative FmdB family regulatory protein
MDNSEAWSRATARLRSFQLVGLHGTTAMPLYEFTCLDCDEPFEALVRSGETPHCPDCAGTRLEKQLSAPAAPVGSHALPMSAPIPAAGCGRPQCGAGRCMMEG